MSHELVGGNLTPTELADRLGLDINQKPRRNLRAAQAFTNILSISLTPRSPGYSHKVEKGPNQKPQRTYFPTDPRKR